MHRIAVLLEDLYGLFFPDLCLACSRNTPVKGDIFCLSCQIKLPKTGFHDHRENPFTERFWGRLPLSSGAAFFHFVKGGRVQHLIHQLKYKEKRTIGLELGRSYGALLRASPFFETVDLIVPVPLHPKKRRKRGYNQSAVFAAGLSGSMGIPWREKVLRRNHYTVTQTQKSRMERQENVWNAFELTDPTAIRGKHILLVDDVLTTGATLEACGARLLEAPGVRLSMATIAISKM